MRDYELVFVLDPDLSSEKRKKQVAKIKKIVTDLKGKVALSEEWGKKDFAYPLGRKNAGYYFFWEIGLPPQSSSKIDPQLRLEGSLLRFLLVRKGKKRKRPEKKGKKKETKRGVKKAK